jgi:hypothetical protein
MAKDTFHKQVKEALQKEGWTITDDPYFLMVGRRRGFIDLGAERFMIAAEKEQEKIAVEIKSFLAGSDLDHFEDALGQFLVYLVALEDKDPDRVLYLAMPDSFYQRFFDDPFFVKLAQRFNVNLLVYDETTSTIVSWIK